MRALARWSGAIPFSVSIFSNGRLAINDKLHRKDQCTSAEFATVRSEIASMADKAKPAEAMQKAAEVRERAAKYEALAAEGRQRGNIEMSIEFDRKAVEELVET